ncbi:hypothetical protein [Psychrobacter sanguinis]|uniref:hypothetical protein n=1 Tax=Psychrobacter sanguinis TaxID=861445 RepID=UPI002A7494E4|nr:hypothetical protein [Psychrobacter sanguinis]MDY3305576.1 hypothetical protein [Psychrobacter sanguinis]
MLWFNETQDDVNKRIMSGISLSLGGTATEDSFWLTELQRNKTNPYKRYQSALKGLPYPAAFREAALGLRAIIREKAKNKQSAEEELTELYKIAVWQSFSMAYSNKAQTSGYSILERIPGSVIANLDYYYQDMGYEKLELINKTDAKRLVELWGEPDGHKTLLEADPKLWMKYEDEYIQIINAQGHAGLYDIKIKELSKIEDKNNTKAQTKERDSNPNVFKKIFKKIF